MDHALTDAPLAPGTPVINIHDAEPGIIVHGTAQHPATGVWQAYAVTTAYGTEIWATAPDVHATMSARMLQSPIHARHSMRASRMTRAGAWLR